MARVFSLNGDCCELQVYCLPADLLKIFPLDDGTDDGMDIKVYIPGPPGPNGGIVDVGTRASPALIPTVSPAIAAQLYQRQRSFIQGASGPVTNPTIPNGQGTYELCLFCTSDANSVTLNNAANIQLSGQWIGRNGSILCLIWDGASKYVEDYRNEI